MKKISYLIISILFIGQISYSQNKEFTSSSVSIFKNGTAFFQKEITQDVDKNKSIITNLPIAEEDVVFGSVWFNATGNKIKKIGTYSDTLLVNKQAETIYSMLKANKSATLSLLIKDYDKVQVGKIQLLKPDLLVFKTKETWITTSPHNVKNIMFSSAPSLTYKEKKQSDLVKIDLAKSKSNQKVSLMYLQKGLTWTPNYYIRITGENKANITLRANVVNDIEDIKNTNINFVVGVPSFSFSHVNSPFISDESVYKFIQTLNGRSGNVSIDLSSSMSNSITAQSMSNYSHSSSRMTNNNNELTGKGSTDEGLFFYTIKNANLKANERAFFELLSTEVEFEQIYSVDLKENTSIYNRYSNSGNNATENQVWHSIRFKNNTETPFTTGTAFIMRKDGNTFKPISQNYLYYTPSGINTSVKTTISPDISVITNEKEIGRKERAIQHHDLITIEASIIIENYKNKALKLEVKRLITGEIVKSSHDYEKISKLKSWNSKNKLNDTMWEINLKAGEKKVITYSYKIYVYR